MNKIDTRRNATLIMLVVAVIAVGISTGSHENAKAQTGASNATSSSKNQTNMMMMGPNITGSISMGQTIAKAIASQVHVSLANASTTAEKAVGANAHAAAVRIGVVHGFLVYMALVVDSNNNFHGVIIDPGNGKVLSSSPMSMEQMMLSGMGINLMGPGMGMMGPGMGMMGPGMGMMQHGMMQGPGMMMRH